MNVFLWVVQIALALHTLMGAVWKFGNSADQAVPSLAKIPPGLWIAMSVVEIVCAICLVIPAFKKNLSFLAPTAAIVIGLEMLAISVVHFASGDPNPAPMIYWLVVAAICAFLAFMRLKRKAA